MNSTKVATPEGCQDLCYKQKTCKAFLFKIETKTCTLKNKNVKEISGNDTVSGPKLC